MPQDLDKYGNPILRAINNKCPACLKRIQHTEEERKQYHPLAGQGYNKEQGWTYAKECTTDER